MNWFWFEMHVTNRHHPDSGVGMVSPTRVASVPPFHCPLVDNEPGTPPLLAVGSYVASEGA